MKFLAQTKLESVVVPIKPAHEIDVHSIANDQIHAAAAIHPAIIDVAPIPAIVRACHHRGILSNLCPNLNNRFSRSLLFV
jgi:hypothetical protein